VRSCVGSRPSFSSTSAKLPLLLPPSLLPAPRPGLPPGVRWRSAGAQTARPRARAVGAPIELAHVRSSRSCPRPLQQAPASPTTCWARGASGRCTAGPCATFEGARDFPIAVKKLNPNSFQGQQEWLCESCCQGWTGGAGERLLPGPAGGARDRHQGRLWRGWPPPCLPSAPRPGPSPPLSWVLAGGDPAAGEDAAPQPGCASSGTAAENGEGMLVNRVPVQGHPCTTTSSQVSTPREDRLLPGQHPPGASASSQAQHPPGNTASSQVSTPLGAPRGLPGGASISPCGDTAGGQQLLPRAAQGQKLQPRRPETLWQEVCGV